jgi:hypothetical protein
MTGPPMSEIDRRRDNDDRWWQAYLALVQRGDQGPLAELFSGTAPIPHSIREHIGRMLNPGTNPGNADRLVFSRSPQFARKMHSHQTKIAVALEVLAEIAAGKEEKNAVTDICKLRGVSDRYIYGAMKLARNLPPYYKDLGRRLPPVWGLNTPKKATKKAKRVAAKGTARKR